MDEGSFRSETLDPLRRFTSRWRSFLLGTCFLAPALAAAQTTASVPSVAQLAFAPSTVASGTATQLAIVFSNANAQAAVLTQAFTNTFPPGLTLANGTVGGSCTTGSVIARSGGGSVTYVAGATIPSGGCTIAVSVKATSTSGNTYFADSVAAGALQTNFGPSATGASATLKVQAAVAAPNVVGLSLSAATAAIQGAGLILGTVTKSASTAPFNTVASQIPAAKASAAAGSAVNIVISLGPNGATNPNSPISTTPGISPAQVSVASAVERTCADLTGLPTSSTTGLQKSLLANCRAIINTYGGGGNATNLNNALNAVSGRQTTAQQETGIKFASTQFTNIAARLTELREGASGVSTAGLDLGLPGTAPLAQLLAALQDANGGGGSAVGGASGDDKQKGEVLGRFGFFVNGNLRRGTEDTTEFETGYNYRDNGVTAGMDYRFTDHLVFGIAYGHSNGSTDFADASAHLDSRSDTASLYGTYYGDSFYIDAIGSYGRLRYHSERTTTFGVDSSLSVNAPNCSGGVCNIDVNGATTAHQYAFGTSIGYDFRAKGLVVGPDVALDYTKINVAGFTENDPTQSGMALSYNDQLGESLILKAGGHLSYSISTKLAVISPQVRVRYDHEFKNDQRVSYAHFAADPTIDTGASPISNFAVFTNLPDRNYFDWATGISAQFPFGISAFVDYNAIAGEQYLRSHEISFGIRFQYLAR